MKCLAEYVTTMRRARRCSDGC